MITRAILTMALLLPVAAQAEDMFKWRDAGGRIHYSNDPEKVPDGAQPVTRKLGEIGGEPVGEGLEAPTEAQPEGPAFAPRVSSNRWKTTTSCVQELGLGALPDRDIDFNRRNWFDIDAMCGPQHDIEGWLRRVSTTLALRQIGL